MQIPTGCRENNELDNEVRVHSVQCTDLIMNKKKEALSHVHFCCEINESPSRSLRATSAEALIRFLQLLFSLGSLIQRCRKVQQIFSQMVYKAPFVDQPRKFWMGSQMNFKHGKWMYDMLV